MSEQSSFDRVRELQSKALARYARRRTERAERAGQPPQIGEIFAFPETADRSVLWTVVDGDDQHCLAIATDLEPFLGTNDIAATDEGAVSVWSLRCAYAARLAAAAFDSATSIAVLDPETVDQARRKRQEIEQGAAAAADLEESDDWEPDYQDWIGEVAKAHAVLGEMQRPEAREASAERFELVRPSRLGASRNVYALAASIFLALAVGWTAGMMYHRKSERPQINVPYRLLIASSTTRGEVQTLEGLSEASSFVLIIETSEDYPLYRLEMWRKKADGPVWTSDDLKKVDRASLTVALPRRRFPDGEYRLRLSGLRDGHAELLAEYALCLESR